MLLLPLHDTESNRYSGLPLMTLALIAVNVSVMVAYPVLWSIFPSVFFRLFGSVPQFVISEQGGGALASITSTFLHGDFFHLFFNMVFLWTFGRRVEDACGSWRFLVFYLFCGVFADLLSTLIRFDDYIPGVGASGAIAGLLGAYLLLFPGGKIRTLVVLVFFPIVPKIQAIWFLLYWIIVQLIAAFSNVLFNNGGNVNYWAHLGGFFASVFVVFFLRPEAFARLLSSEAV